jgi:hypothetical protein
MDFDKPFRMPDSWYDPPEWIPCCADGEDDEDHDVEQCLADQAEEAAERKAEAMREREMDEHWFDEF